MKMHMLLAVIGLGFSSLVGGQTIPAAPHIVINGYAERTVRPDKFVLPLEITTVSKNPGTAAQIEKQTAEMVAKLQGMGVKDEDIKVGNLIIDKEYDRGNFIGNYYTRNLEVAFRDKGKLIEFLSSIDNIRNLEIGSIERRVDNIDKLKYELLKEAVANSKHRAEMLSAQYGMRVLGVHAISTVGISGDIRVGSNYDGGTRTLDRVEVTGSRIRRQDLLPPVQQLLQEGTVDVKENIYVVFLIGK